MMSLKSNLYLYMTPKLSFWFPPPWDVTAPYIVLQQTVSLVNNSRDRQCTASYFINLRTFGRHTIEQMSSFVFGHWVATPCPPKQYFLPFPLPFPNETKHWECKIHRMMVRSMLMQHSTDTLLLWREKSLLVKVEMKQMVISSAPVVIWSYVNYTTEPPSMK